MNKQHRTNRELVRDILKQKIAAQEEKRYLNSWACNTHCCVLGEYVRRKLGIVYPLTELDKEEIKATCISLGLTKAKLIEEFGHIMRKNPYQAQERLAVFGAADSGTLQQRLDFVEKLLDE